MASFLMSRDGADDIDLDTEKIKEWRSILTLIVFVLANIIVLFPFRIPIWVPRKTWDAYQYALSALRIKPPPSSPPGGDPDAGSRVKRLDFPMNFVTAPLIADLFLLAVGAIGQREVHDGTLGSENIQPIDIMAFFITLAYIAISIDASGLIRYLAFKVLQWGGKLGHRLFFYLYAFFFVLGSLIGNDPIILSGTAFLSYMTRVSSNIRHPRAWIHTQFAVANIASAILVSSNPTNLVLAGAFNIKFIDYTKYMIVPVVITAIVLFPFLLYIIFADEDLIPNSIDMHELPPEVRDRAPVNPNIPHGRGAAEEVEEDPDNPEGQLLSLEEVMHPFLDKGGALFGGVVMMAALVTVLVLNAYKSSGHETPVFYVTLPAAFVMLCWDIAFGWINREKTRAIAREGRRQIELLRAERAVREEEARKAELARAKPSEELVVGTAASTTTTNTTDASQESSPVAQQDPKRSNSENLAAPELLAVPRQDSALTDVSSETAHEPASSEKDVPRELDEKAAVRAMAEDAKTTTAEERPLGISNGSPPESNAAEEGAKKEEDDEFQRRINEKLQLRQAHKRTTLVSLTEDCWRWMQETFPTCMAVMAHLPFALIPFAFCMFILVQALVTKGWVPVFGYGWDHWVAKTGVIGAIGGMGFLSVILCNFAGTNIGTTILLCRVIQAWEKIHLLNGVPISDRTFWATVYSMAIGVNYGAFSSAFSASLAGLLWRDILRRKHIHVRGLEFARVNLPIIAIAMAVGLTALVGEVYIVRSADQPYSLT